MSVPSGGPRSTGPLAWRLAVVVGLAALTAMLLAVPLPMPSAILPDAARPDAVRPDAGRPGSGVDADADADAARWGNSPTEALTARPVFAPSRRPWVPPARPAQPEQAVGVLDDHVLVGVMISDGASRALVRLPGGRTVSLAEGDRLEGWVLERIAERGLRFVVDGASYDMAFRPRSEIGP